MVLLALAALLFVALIAWAMVTPKDKGIEHPTWNCTPQVNGTICDYVPPSDPIGRDPSTPKKGTPP